jgi:ABC-type uncharacterized transport system involved in gliding motility auxiliary subunit
MKRRPTRRRSRRSAQRGGVLGLALQALLLVAVLGQIVFLAANWRVRFDTTSEGLYTLSDSTRRVLEGLEDRLLIEAYFSPDEELSQGNRVGREVLRGLLDEFVQTSGGKVRVRYFDPASDRELRDRAIRLGIRPVQVSDQDNRTLSLREFWQGLRLRYGGQRQRVIGQLQPRIVPALYETELTPVIKALSVEDKPTVGVIAYPSPPPSAARGQAPTGFGVVFQDDQITSRYALERIDWDQGQEIPETIGIVLLIRPRNLTDAQKLSLDQFVMRGGQLVVFADTDDYELGSYRTMRRREQSFDAPGSEVRLRDMLERWGVDLDPDHTTVDLLPEAYFGQYYYPVQTQVGRQLLPVPYPHFLRSRSIDWNSEEIRLKLARDDSVLAESYADRFGAGIAEGHPLGAQFVSSQGPFLFWPAQLSLHEPLPEGVGARVVMRTSPYAVAIAPKPSFDPTGGAVDPTMLAQNLQQYATGMMRQRDSFGPRQYDLMIDLSGTFPSCFAGRELPESIRALRAGADGAGEEGQDGGEDAPAPELIERSPETARVVVIADSDFVRDDLVRGDYARLGGPASGEQGRIFMRALLDWLAQDDDLVALRSRSLVDRGIALVESSALSDDEPWRAVERLEEARARLQWIYLCVPTGALLLIGAFVWFRRSAAKRRFLASVA